MRSLRPAALRRHNARAALSRHSRSLVSGHPYVTNAGWIQSPLNPPDRTPSAASHTERRRMAQPGRARAAFAGAGLVALIALAPTAALAQTAPTALRVGGEGTSVRGDYTLVTAWMKPATLTPAAYRLFRCAGRSCTIGTTDVLVASVALSGDGSGEQQYRYLGIALGSLGGTIYSHAVQGLNSAGNLIGALSAPTRFTTPFYNPAAPSNLAATATDGTVALTWNALPDNPDNRSITGYRIFREETPSGSGDIATALVSNYPGTRRTTSYSDTTVVGGRSYDYQIFAINSAQDRNGQGDRTARATVELPSSLTAGDVHHAILPQVARAMTDSVAAAISGRIQQAADSAASAGPAFRLGGPATLHDALAATAGPAFRPSGNEMRHDALTVHASTGESGALDLPRLLNGSSFVLPLNAADNGAANPGALAFWGRGDYRNLEGGDGLNWDGGLASASIGLDGRPRPDVLLGVALAYSDGAFDYDTADAEGEYDITMTSVHPYLGWSLGRLDLWATAGYGEGEIEITPQVGTASSSDAALRSVALGASGQLLSAEGWLNMPGATAVRLKSEASATRIDVDGDAATEAADLSVDATRFRLALEGTNERTLASGATVSPSLELGVRYDGGDGDSGAGLELGGGARYANAATGLSVEGKARVLAGRDDYDEWSIQGSLAMRPGADGQGLSFSLSPGYGGGLQQLGRQGLPEDGDDAAADYSARLEARLGYGFAFALNGHDGMLTPYSELTLGATNRYRAGMNWKAGTRFGLTLLGERREPSTAPAEHAILIKGEVRF